MSAPNAIITVQTLLPQQLEAAHTHQSVWVAASAGTGKTKILTDRVLRLLLPRANGEAGTLPNQILCVTFTNAAAAQMIERVLKTAKSWLHKSDEELAHALTALCGEAATPSQITAARQLFARIVDTPGGLKIMTLHAFGQSVLRRFPLEAGIAPGFILLTEQDSRDMMAQAQDAVFAKALSDAAHPLHDIITRLMRAENGDRLQSLIQHVQKEQQYLNDFFAENPDRNAQKNAFMQALNIASNA
jgi:ATP-dependent helicase/nuclease subunit A